MAGKGYGIWVEPEVMERIDQLAGKAGLTRNRLIANILDVASQSLVKSEKFGLLKVALLLRDFEESCKSWVEAIRDEGDIRKEILENGGYQSSDMRDL